MTENIAQPAEFEKIVAFVSDLAASKVHYDFTQQFDESGEEVEYLKSHLPDCLKFIEKFDSIVTYLNDNIGFTNEEKETSSTILSEGYILSELKQITDEIESEIIPFLDRCLELEIEPKLINEDTVANIRSKLIPFKIFIAGSFKQ